MADMSEMEHRLVNAVGISEVYIDDGERKSGVMSEQWACPR